MATSVMENRLRVLENLYFALGVPFPLATIEGIALEGLESNEIPTIGAEIEVPWQTVMDDYDVWFNEKYRDFSPEKKKSFDERCNKLDIELLGKYQKTVEAGIPNTRKSNFEGYHEFGHLPVNWYETLAAEIEMLMNAGLAPINKNLPMHVTLGGIEKGREIGIALGIIQLIGGSNKERLLQPTKESRTWNAKGDCGTQGRNAYDMQGRFSYGVELRTLVAENPKQVRKTLRCAQLLGTMIHARQNSNGTDLENELKERWFAVEEKMLTQILRPNNLSKWWQNPAYSLEEWNRFGDLYGRRETNQFLDEVEEILQESEDQLITLGQRSLILPKS